MFRSKVNVHTGDDQRREWVQDKSGQRKGLALDPTCYSESKLAQPEALALIESCVWDRIRTRLMISIPKSGSPASLTNRFSVIVVDFQFALLQQ